MSVVECIMWPFHTSHYWLLSKIKRSSTVQNSQWICTVWIKNINITSASGTFLIQDCKSSEEFPNAKPDYLENCAFWSMVHAGFNLYCTQFVVF